MALATESSKYMVDQPALTLDEKLASIFQPDTLLPAQYFETYRKNTLLEPEKRLMLAILEDAVQCFQDNVLAQSGRRKRLFEEAEEWILEEDDDRVFSFVNICETFGIHPQYLRKGLMKWKQRRLRGQSRAAVHRLPGKTQTKIQQGEMIYG
ncbi:MAG: hypothetical protein ACREQA_06125 [Candidatus Binatia bacterium]